MSCSPTFQRSVAKTSKPLGKPACLNCSRANRASNIRPVARRAARPGCSSVARTAIIRSSWLTACALARPPWARQRWNGFRWRRLSASKSCAVRPPRCMAPTHWVVSSKSLQGKAAVRRLSMLKSPTAATIQKSCQQGLAVRTTAGATVFRPHGMKPTVFPASGTRRTALTTATTTASVTSPFPATWLISSTRITKSV